MMPGPMRDREVDLACWTVESAMEAGSNCFMEAWEEISIEINDLPFWAFVRRHRLRTQANACMRLFYIFGTYSKEQADRIDAQHGPELRPIFRDDGA